MSTREYIAWQTRLKNSSCLKKLFLDWFMLILHNFLVNSHIYSLLHWSFHFYTNEIDDYTCSVLLKFVLFVCPQETLLVGEVTEGSHSKFRERRVFLFEQIIIFSEVIEDKKRGSFSDANYIYKNSVTVRLYQLLPFPCLHLFFSFLTFVDAQSKFSLDQADLWLKVFQLWPSHPLIRQFIWDYIDQ